MSYYLNRLICDVFDEMRTCVETLNFSYLKSLIEEAQVMANRMEAGLSDKHDLSNLRDQISEFEKKKIKLQKEVEELEDQIEKNK